LAQQARHLGQPEELRSGNRGRRSGRRIRAGGEQSRHGSRILSKHRAEANLTTHDFGEVAGEDDDGRRDDQHQSDDSG